MAISFGGGLYEWSNARILTLFVTSGILWILFIAQQGWAIGTSKEHRLFPVEYLFDRHMNIFFAQTASAVTVTFIPLYFIPLYFQFTQNDSALKAGVRLLPLVCFQVLGTVFSGVYLQKVGYYQPLYFMGGVFSLAGGLLFHFVKLDTPSANIYGYSALLGLGPGLFVQTSYPVAQLKVSIAEIPKIVSFIGYGQITGITLALCVSSSAFLNIASNRISDILPHLSRDVITQAFTGTGGHFFATLSTQDRRPVLSAISQVIGDIYIMVIAAAGLTTILSAILPWERISTQKVQSVEPESQPEKETSLIA